MSILHLININAIFLLKLLFLRKRFCGFCIDGEPNQLNLHMFMTLEEFIVALERGTGAKFRVFEKQTWIRKQIVFIVESMHDKKSSKHCVSFGTEKHCKMNSFGYSDTGFDFTRNSVTLTDQLLSLLEYIWGKEYVEIKQPIFSTNIEKWLQS